MIRKSNHIIAGNIRVAFILLLLNFLTVNISAQPQHRTVETRLKEYFRTYQSPEVEIGTCKLVRFQLNAKKRTLAVYANTNFGHQPFRPQTTEKIYADLRKRLPGPVNYYNITIFVGDKSIDDLIPNIYRKTKDNTRLWGRNTHRGHAWVSNLSRPYSISEGLQGRHLAITPSHGKYYHNDEARWKWQRPSLYATREDLLSQSIVVPYLIPMLENAGAVVFSARERDRNPYDIIIDNDANVARPTGKTASSALRFRKAFYSMVRTHSIMALVASYAQQITRRIPRVQPFGFPPSPNEGTMPYMSATSHTHQAYLMPSILCYTREVQPALVSTNRWVVVLGFISAPSSSRVASMTIKW